MLYQEAEKFIKDIFWSESHNKDNKLNIPEIVGQKLLRDNKEKDPEYYNHREGVLHVTSLSKCLRGVVHEMLGAEKDNPPDTRKLGVFKAGNLFEDYIVEALGNKMLDRQTEYVFKYKGVILTGRDDGTILHEGVHMILENKSVHSDSFWYREKEGTLVATQNQQQIQTYLWLRRILPNVFVHELVENESIEKDVIYTNLTKEELIVFKNIKEPQYDIAKSLYERVRPDNSQLNGIFCYISKDDCTIAQAPVKFNQRIIDEVVIPALDIIADGYAKKDPSIVPAPPLVRYEESKHQNQVNWVCKYCDYHNKCAGTGWLLEAQNEVTRLNKELNQKMVNIFAKKEKPIIGVDTGTPDGDKTVLVAGKIEDGGTLKIEKMEVSEPLGDSKAEVSPNSEIKNNLPQSNENKNLS